MSALLTRLARPFTRLLRREEGTASIEFVIFFPFFFTIMISSIELGMILTRQVILDRSVDLAVRQMRLGAFPNPSAEILKSEICDNAIAIPNCTNELMVELQNISAPAYTMPDAAAKCRNRSSDIQPIVTFRDGPENEMMVIRVCALVDPLFPGTGLGLAMQKNTVDGFALVSTSAYVNEPGAGSSDEGS